MMLTRRLGNKKKRISSNLKGCIVSANDNSVIVKVSGDTAPYQKGQRIMVSIPHKRRTALGKIIKVSEVIAHGEITNIAQNAVTIQSRITSPIISKSALREDKGKEQLMFVESVD